MMSGKRILYLDYARAFTALLVIYGHLYTPSSSNLIRSLIYQFHMPLFFVISGMLHKSTGTIQWKKYIKRILVPIISFAALYAVVTFPLYRWCGWFDYKESAPKSIFEGVTTIRSAFEYLKYYVVGAFYGRNMLNGPCWFLVALLWCKLFTDFFSKSRITKVIAIALWAVAFLFEIMYGKKPLFIGQTIIALPYFILGYMGKSHIDHLLSSRCRVAVFFIAILVLGFATYFNRATSMFAVYFGSMDFPINILLFYAAGLSGSFVILFISSLIRKESFISRSSKALITILGLQVIFIFIVDNIIGYNLDYFVSIVIAVVIFFLCVGSHLLFERYSPAMIGLTTNGINKQNLLQ